MKYIAALLLSLGTLTSIQAETGNRPHRPNRGNRPNAPRRNDAPQPRIDQEKEDEQYMDRDKTFVG